MTTWIRKRGALVNGGPLPLFTISSGPVLITALFGIVSTVIGAGATTILLQSNPTVGADTALSVGSVITAAPAGSLCSITGIVTDALIVILATQGAIRGMVPPLIVNPGTIELVVVGGTTGAIDWGVQYSPLDTESALLST